MLILEQNPAADIALVGQAPSVKFSPLALTAHFNSLNINHTYWELPGVGHDPMQALLSLGGANWLLYRSVFGMVP